jgi:hypothetical protein
LQAKLCKSDFEKETLKKNFANKILQEKLCKKTSQKSLQINFAKQLCKKLCKRNFAKGNIFETFIKQNLLIARNKYYSRAPSFEF